jgi:predicted kinase
MCTIVIMSGIPASGKTTFINQYALVPLTKDLSIVRICPNEIRVGKFGAKPYDPKDNIVVWSEVYSRINIALATGISLIFVEGYNTTIAERQRYFQRFEKCPNVSFIAVRMITSYPISLSRNNQRPRPILERHMLEFNNRIEQEPPTRGEGFAKILEVSGE